MLPLSVLCCVRLEWLEWTELSSGSPTVRVNFTSSVIFRLWVKISAMGERARGRERTRRSKRVHFQRVQQSGAACDTSSVPSRSHALQWCAHLWAPPSQPDGVVRVHLSIWFLFKSIATQKQNQNQKREEWECQTNAYVNQIFFVVFFFLGSENEKKKLINAH